jgi:hypothetical protein
VPPVALTIASASAQLSSRATRALAECSSTECAAPEAAPMPMPVPLPAPAEIEPPVPLIRPHLRLVSSAAPTTGETHGRGGPASCQCRSCVMARHPAFLPRLTVVR